MFTVTKETIKCSIAAKHELHCNNINKCDKITTINKIHFCNNGLWNNVSKQIDFKLAITNWHCVKSNKFSGNSKDCDLIKVSTDGIFVDGLNALFNNFSKQFVARNSETEPSTQKLSICSLNDDILADNWALNALCCKAGEVLWIDNECWNNSVTNKSPTPAGNVTSCGRILPHLLNDSIQLNAPQIIFFIKPTNVETLLKHDLHL